MRIESAHFEDFPPFANGKIEFPAKPADSKLAEVHFLVGANGAGKTRLLSLLLAALGNRASLAARVGETRLRAAVTASVDQWKSIYSDAVGFAGWVPEEKALSAPQEMHSSNQTNYKMTSPGFVSALQNAQKLSMERFALAYDGVARMNDQPVEALKPVALNKMGQLLVLELPDAETRKAVAQSLANLKTRASMDATRNGGPSRTMKMVKHLEDTVSEVTGRPFAFTLSYQPSTALKVIWGNDDQDMPLMSLPDGLRGILGWLAATVARLDVAFPDHPDPLNVPFILIVDEPEGHLHPGWQRLIIPATQRLFPNAQIFVATHSPFMVSSVNEGFIHILETRNDGKVTARDHEECKKGDTYQDVLEDVLGMTLWYDPETEGLLSDFRKLRDEVLKGAWAKLPDLEALSQQIAERGQSLNNVMGREMAKVNRAKPV